MLSGMVKKITGSYIIKYKPDPNKDEEVEINFKPPFAKVKMIPELEKKMNVTFPKDLSTEETRLWLMELIKKYKIKCSSLTTSKMIDKLCGEFIEPFCVNPTFICDHPQG
jgi:lysyl-tRNA synthetase class 2